MTTTTTRTKAEEILAKCTSPQLVEIYVHAFDNVTRGDQTGWMAAAEVRGWAQTTLDARGDGHLLTAALGVCNTCWTTLDGGECPECLDDAHEAELLAR